MTTTSAADHPPRLLLTPEECALALGIGRTRIYDLIARGVLASVRIGKSRRIAIGDLERFIDSLRDDTSSLSSLRGTHV
jgi:excisionase family DNA binding protein